MAVTHSTMATTAALRATDLGVEAIVSKPFDVTSLLGTVRALLSLPPQVSEAMHHRDPIIQLRSMVDDLVACTSVLLMAAEQVADAQKLSDHERPLSAIGLDAAQRTSALVRRLAHLIGSVE